MNYFVRAALIAMALTLESCAFLLDGTSQDISVRTTPVAASCQLMRQGAVVATIAQTPGLVNLPKTRDDIVIACKKAGFKDAVYVAHSGVAGAAYANAIGAGLGLAVDAATGASNKYESDVSIALVQAGPYRLDTGDTVRVIVYNQASLSSEYKVGDSGNISMPLLGDVKARALSTEELRTSIYDGLNNGIFVNPGVSVEVSQYRPFYVVGEVTRPGQYAYTPGMSVLGAVAAAGGFTVRAQMHTMSMYRKQDGASAEASADSLTEVQPGDVIVVRERFF